MSSTKAQLKSIADSVKQSKWEETIQKSRDFLDRDPKNHQAYVTSISHVTITYSSSCRTIFLAFALDKKNRLDEAEEAYKNATVLKPQDSQAWQGLIKLYEKQGAAKIPTYQQAAVSLAGIWRDANELHKCRETVEKFIDYVRVHGDRLQYAEALGITLPESPLYHALEGLVPHPAKTYDTVAQITETEEKKRINTLIGERRTRIGAKISEVTVEVKREVWGKSQLAHIYHQLINWTNDDETRRIYEEKLLQWWHEWLLVSRPGQEKAQALQMVLKLALDMVIIKHPFRLAWDIAINWKDSPQIHDWDVNMLRDYCVFFPETDLYKVITGYLTSDISPFPKQAPAPAGDMEASSEDESEDDDGGGVSMVPLTDEDRLIMMSDGIATADSLLAYRLMGAYYEHLEEHESIAELMRKAFKHLSSEIAKTGLAFQHTADAFSLHLGTALVFWQSPRHHAEAKSLFDGVLAHNASSTPALIGVGLIYEEEEDYDDAIDFLERASQRDESNLRVKTEAAWVKALKGDFEPARSELEVSLPLIEAKGAAAKELLALTQYRIGSCIWHLDTSKTARKSRSGAYSYFLEALRNDLNLAPAYTSLGVYYADYAKDKKRARRCFQKAVELSTSEVVAAERLARSFADDGDWDRVELVAQRVVDSGKVKPPPGSKRKGVSWPFAALGVAELNKQDFHKAIVSFQSALRIAPEDYHSWVGLGESYYSSGRYIAATKAIMNAQKLEETTSADALGDTWFTKYMLANVKREIGEFDDSIILYKEVLVGRPGEDGVAIALMQTLVENALHSVEKGFFGKAVELALDSIDFASKAQPAITATFNYWKALGDACSVFTAVKTHALDFPKDAMESILQKDGEGAYETLKDVDKVGVGVVFAKGIFSQDETLGVDLTRCIHATILCHKRAIHVSAMDVHAQAVAYYNLGWAEYRAHACLPLNMRAKSSTYRKASLRCFKRAIELEAGNPEFWNALGVVTSEINPAVSQHSFVRSLHLNERNPAAWTNLGTLAVLQNDLKLANESFTRAQSTDPDYAHAWLGQAFVALLYGDLKEARGLFTHAMEISESSLVSSRRHYPVAMFDHVLTAPRNLNITALIQPIFALGQLESLAPDNLAWHHLLALFKERTYDSARAIASLERICANLERDYELTESAQALAHFAQAKTDLARLYLAAGSYVQAILCGEMAIQLSCDDSDNELTKEARTKARLSAHLTVGLAQYYSNDVKESVQYFQVALDESNGNPDAVCLLAQVYWATGEESARELARAALFEVIEKQPNHVQSVLLLGVIALLDDDEVTMEAVWADLRGLRTNDHVLPSEQSHIGEVLGAMAALTVDGAETSEGVDAEVLGEIQTDIMLQPHLPHGWSKLTDIMGDEYPAEMALKVALRAVPPRGTLDASGLSKAYAGTGRAADAQISIMLAPWDEQGWQALGEAISGR